MSEKEKSTAGTRKERGGWATLLMQSVFGSLESMVHGIFASISQATQGFTLRLVRYTFLVLAASLGIVFFLVGVAQFLSVAYRMPGAGQMVVGLSLLVVTLVVHIFTKKY